MSRETSAAKRFAAGTGDTHARSGPPGRAEEGIVAPERIVDEARESAYRFLEAQRDKSVTRGGTWEARELTRLFVHFWESGRNAVQSDQSTSVEVDGQ